MPRDALGDLIDRLTDALVDGVDAMFQRHTGAIPGDSPAPERPRRARKARNTPKADRKRQGAGKSQRGTLPDYYAVLEVHPSASVETIQAAFRALSKKCHPDANPGDKRAEERFKRLTEARDVLMDVEKRRAYDRARG